MAKPWANMRVEERKASSQNLQAVTGLLFGHCNGSIRIQGFGVFKSYQ